MAKSKCVTCKTSLPTEEMILVAGKKYCEACSKIKEEEIFNKEQEIIKKKEEEVKKKEEQKLAKSQKEKTDYNLLVDIIKEIYNIKVPTGLMFQQLKNYRGEGYNFTDIGMYYTLKYYYQTLGNPVKENTVGIIPYFYDKSKWHFSKVFDMQDLADNTILDEKTININTKQAHKTIKKILPLSLESVREEVDNKHEDID